MTTGSVRTDYETGVAARLGKYHPLISEVASIGEQA